MARNPSTSPEIFVSPDWIERNPDVVPVDVRRDWEYEQGHLPGAVSIPFEQFRDPGEESRGKLPTREAFATLLGDAGIESGDRILAYDDEYGVYASRFLVTAELFGHDLGKLFVLDGDVEPWRADRETTTDVPAREPVTDEWEVITNGPLVTARELESALETDAVVVDTRDKVEYDTVHLPGAVNFQWQSLVDESARRLLPPDERRAVLADAGITPDRPIRLYCNTARRLSFVYAVLRELGYDDVAFYEGGIDTWADYGGPVETSPS